MKALDTNVILRFLLNDDDAQGLRAKELFESAERSGGRLAITWPVLLDTIWVLSAVHEFRRKEVLDALEILAQMPVLQFQDYDGLWRLIRMGRETKPHLPDLLIGLAGHSWGCETTLTFERGVSGTGLFEQIGSR